MTKHISRFVEDAVPSLGTGDEFPDVGLAGGARLRDVLVELAATDLRPRAGSRDI
jgi:hypothetical protein